MFSFRAASENAAVRVRTAVTSVPGFSPSTGSPTDWSDLRSSSSAALTTSRPRAAFIATTASEAFLLEGK